MIGYTIVFYSYTISKNVVLKQSCIVILILIITIAYVYTENDHQVLLNRLGKTKNCTFLKL